MAKKIPEADAVAVVYVYPGAYGFRYTCRGHDRRVLYDSPRAFKSRYTARDEIKKRWPQARVSFEV